MDSSQEASGFLGEHDLGHGVRPMRVRASKKRQSVMQQREAAKEKRAAESKLRRDKRKEKGTAEDVAKAIKRSPGGKAAAESLKLKRRVARKQEQMNYQKTRTRASARLGGRRKQTLAEFQEQVDE
jgi:hypothetical protein